MWQGNYLQFPTSNLILWYCFHKYFTMAISVFAQLKDEVVILKYLQKTELPA